MEPCKHDSKISDMSDTLKEVRRDIKYSVLPILERLQVKSETRWNIFNGFLGGIISIALVMLTYYLGKR